jgi:predicted SAM-dependent methyltransferase
MEVPAGTNRVRLNLGAGDKVVDGWTSVGLAEHHDIRSDVRRLPLPDHYADEAMAIHVLEHLNRWDAPAALREWRRVLKPGGLLILELPDLLKCCKAVLSGAVPHNGLLGLFGDPGLKDELMMHRWGWTPAEVIKELQAAGFTKIRERTPEFHGKRIYRDMRIEARA